MLMMQQHQHHQHCQGVRFARPGRTAAIYNHYSDRSGFYYGLPCCLLLLATKAAGPDPAARPKIGQRPWVSAASCMLPGFAKEQTHWTSASPRSPPGPHPQSKLKFTCFPEANPYGKGRILEVPEIPHMKTAVFEKWPPDACMGWAGATARPPIGLMMLVTSIIIITTIIILIGAHFHVCSPAFFRKLLGNLNAKLESLNSKHPP